MSSVGHQWETSGTRSAPTATHGIEHTLRRRNLTRTASHARGENGTRFPSCSLAFSQPPTSRVRSELLGRTALRQTRTGHSCRSFVKIQQKTSSHFAEVHLRDQAISEVHSRCKAPVCRASESTRTLPQAGRPRALQTACREYGDQYSRMKMCSVLFWQKSQTGRFRPSDALAPDIP